MGCCTEDFPCGPGEGNCNSDEDCKDDHVCGRRNCNPDFPSDTFFLVITISQPASKIVGSCVSSWQEKSAKIDFYSIYTSGSPKSSYLIKIEILLINSRFCRTKEVN